LRPIAISTGDYIDRISYRDLARTKPMEFARALSGMPRTDRVKILDELDRTLRARIEREVSRDGTEPRMPIRDIDRAMGRSTAIVPGRLVRETVERVPSRVSERVPSRIPERTLIRIPERIPERVPEHVPDRVPSRIPERVPIRVPERIPTRTPVVTTPRIPGVPGTPKLPPRISVSPAVPPPKITITTIDLPSGEQLQLTKDQMDGAVAWKQGKLKVKGKIKPLYIMKYPDKNGRYPAKNTVYTFDPVEGVLYHEGIGSVAKSITKKHGEIPAELKFSMGIQDVRIYRDRQPGIQKPKIEFSLRSKHHRVGKREATPSLVSTK
jgi:hypothetical protein